MCAGGQVRMFGLVAQQLTLQLAWGWLLFKSKRLGLAALVGCAVAASALLTVASFAEVAPPRHAVSHDTDELHPCETCPCWSRTLCTSTLFVAGGGRSCTFSPAMLPLGLMPLLHQLFSDDGWA